jgi:hypothetical protein
MQLFYFIARSSKQMLHNKEIYKFKWRNYLLRITNYSKLQHNFLKITLKDQK